MRRINLKGKEMQWHKWPEQIPPVDGDLESGYLLLACDHAVVPITGYFTKERNEFHMLGCPNNFVLKGVRYWTAYPKLPAEIFDSPFLLNHARQSNLIEEK
jgi:hypothetical protein